MPMTDALTYFDYGALGWLALTALLGGIRGGVEQLYALGLWGAGLACAWFFAADLSLFIQQHAMSVRLPHLPPHATIVLAVVLILLPFWLFRLFTHRLLIRFVQWAGFGWPDTLLGGALGAARGMLGLLFCAWILVWATATYHVGWAAWQQARSRPLLEYALHGLNGILPLPMPT